MTRFLFNLAQLRILKFLTTDAPHNGLAWGPDNGGVLCVPSCPNRKMPARLDDLRALEGGRMLSLVVRAGPSFADGRILPAAYEAVTENCWFNPTDFVLRLLYLLAGADTSKTVTSTEIATETGWPKERVERTADRLEQ